MENIYMTLKKRRKKYINEILEYEGKYLYLYNKKNNGKIYDENTYHFDDYLLFGDEYLNEKRNGNGKAYYHKCDLIFEGEYLN